MKSNTSACLPGSGDSNSDSKGREILSHHPRTGKGGKPGRGPLVSSNHCFTLDTTPHYLIEHSSASASRRSTGSPAKCSPTDSRTSRTTETQSQSTRETFRTLICSVEDFLARHVQGAQQYHHGVPFNTFLRMLCPTKFGGDLSTLHSFVPVSNSLYRGARSL